MNKFFKKIEKRNELLLWLIAGFSPLGVFVPSLLLFYFNVCRGGLSVGITCSIASLESYPGETLMAMEGSLYLFGAGLLWFALAIFIWLKIFSYFFRAVLSRNQKFNNMFKKVRLVLLAAAALTSIVLIILILFA